MKLEIVGSNMTELSFDNGTRVLFSYNTPVAAYSNALGGYVRTEEKWSQTTSRHISKWLDGRKADEVAQSALDNLLKE
jgi:hypothetical protein